MTIEEQIKYWLDLAERDVPVAESMFEKGHYMWCLYIGHLILEKSLKATYVQQNQLTPPKTHDLLKIAKSANLTMNDETEEFLSKVNDFNIEARYPDYKSNFYKICTKEFAETNLKKILNIFEWIKKQIK